MAKCIDFKGITPPCVRAGVPNRWGILSCDDMITLGYIKCDLDNNHYLANADRGCDTTK